MKCRLCSSDRCKRFLSLGKMPLANAYVCRASSPAQERKFKLDVYVCRTCYLVQIGDSETPEGIFGEYAYFSSFSDTWLDHVSDYAQEMTAQAHLGPGSLVVEVASNDGHLLKCFQKKGVPVLGIEPARNVAKAAQKNGVPTRPVFFGRSQAEQLRREGVSADLIVANNVMAHVPDLNDFVAGFRLILKERGVLTVEFPHLLNLLEKNQFDTIYHEHFSYFSFTTAEKVLLKYSLKVYDVKTLPTHGGSLRLYACHEADATKTTHRRVSAMRRLEARRGLFRLATYERFAKKTAQLKRSLRAFLSDAKRASKQVVAYGAPAKGNTLLNYCGIEKKWIDYTVDRNGYKQGKLLPGSRIPIEKPEMILKTKPDYVLILPWNIQIEIREQMSVIRSWKGRFIVPIPDVKVVS